MIGKVIGALVGAEVERKRKASPVNGAIVGAVAMGVMRRLGPVGLLLGGAYVAKKALDRRREDDAPGATPSSSPRS